MLTPGRTTATIESNSVRMAGDKEIVSLVCNTFDGDVCQVTIWLTPKAMGIARRQLKVCGYDPDKNSLAELDANPALLAGKTIPIEVEDWNGKLQAKIVTSDAPPKKRLFELDKALRDVKKREAIATPASSGGDDDIPF